MMIQTDSAHLQLPLAQAREIVTTRMPAADYPDAHAVSVAAYAVRIAAELDLEELEIGVVAAGALLHDVGKLMVDRRVLEKRGALTPVERAEVNTHAAEGEQLVSGMVDHRTAEVVRSHHERWDGSGYPDGRAADAIPIAARIVAVADAFQAMQEDRPYRPALAREAALAELRSCSGSQFDPRCVRALETVVAD